MFVTNITPRVSETDGVGHINNVFVPIWFEAGRREIFRIFSPRLDFKNWRLALVKIEVEYVDQCLDILQNEWNGHIGVYAHSGTSIAGDWTFNNVISAEGYCAYSTKWKQRGINFIGGCCGVHTDHIHMMRKDLFANTR